MTRSKKPKPKSERAQKAARAKRIALYRQARAVLALGVLRLMQQKAQRPGVPKYALQMPSYYRLARDFGIADYIKVGDLADEIWNDANGPEDISIKSEERALERLNTLLESELENDE